MHRLLICLTSLLLCGLLLVGCGDQKNPGQESLISDTKDTVPSNNTDTPDTEPMQMPFWGCDSEEKLKLTSWDSGRANRTSNGVLWETDSGYYMSYQLSLFYADKTDLGNWVPVCCRPECPHKLQANDDNLPEEGPCEAYIGNSYILKDDRIFFIGTASDAAVFWDSGINSGFIASMALDSSDKRVEYVFEDIETYANGGAFAWQMLLNEYYCLHSFSVQNEEGTYDNYVYMADENGASRLASTTTEDSTASCLSVNAFEGLAGDQVFRNAIIDGNFANVYRIDDRELTTVDLEGLPVCGSYLSGDTMRVFRPNDGYYDIELKTRQEVRLGDSQLTNSYAYIVAPNCILESSLIGLASRQLRADTETHRMKMFDGENWTDIRLPEDLVHASDSVVLIPVGITSDRVILMCSDTADRISGERVLYQILLECEDPALTQMGTIG